MNSLKLLYLSIFSLVFVATFALSMTIPRQPRKIIVSTDSEVLAQKDYPPVPVLKGPAEIPFVSAISVFAVDVSSGVSLYEKNPDQLLFPASTTKMITALTALDYYDLDEILRVDGVKVEGQKMGLMEGEEITVRDLISGLLIYSANDAAEVLAANYCDSRRLFCGREQFVKAMNEKAQKLHLDNSNFVNPSGLDSIGHLTTARDLSRIAIEGMNNSFFSSVVGTKEELVTSQDGKIKHKLVNLNELLGKVDGVLGIKTGWTQNAKENLVTYVDRDGKKVVVVLLGSQDRFSDTKKIIDFIFTNYTWKNVRI